MKNKIAFLTAIFPMNEEYLDDFFQSLSCQTFKEFDVLVINDGYEKFEDLLFKYNSLSLIEIPYRDTPAKNREFGINFAIKNGYDILFLGDSDDYFACNRVEKSLELLLEYDIVVNDLTLFDKAGIHNDHYISNRVKNNVEIKFEFIKDKNIFGFSNTAFKLKSFKNIFFDKDIIAVDWYFFSTLLLENKKAVFTNETTTYYRQHPTNTIGLGVDSVENINLGLAIKKKHYELLKDYNPEYQYLYQDAIKITANDKYYHYLSECKKDLPEYPLWWENIKLPGVEK